MNTEPNTETENAEVVAAVTQDPEATEAPGITDVDPEPIQVAAETMGGQLQQALVDVLKTVERPWGLLAPREQDRILERFDRVVQDALRQGVRIIAADSRPNIGAKIEQLTAKDGIKVVLTIQSTDPARHQLLDRVGATALLVIADPEPYSGGEKPKADAAQPELPGVNLGPDGLPPGGSAFGEFEDGTKFTVTRGDEAPEASQEPADGPEPPDGGAQAGNVAPGDAPAALVRNEKDMLDLIDDLPEGVTGIAEILDADAVTLITASWTDEQWVEARAYFTAMRDGDDAVPERPAFLPTR